METQRRPGARHAITIAVRNAGSKFTKLENSKLTKNRPWINTAQKTKLQCAIPTKITAATFTAKLAQQSFATSAWLIPTSLLATKSALFTAVLKKYAKICWKVWLPTSAMK